jgi:hypothetical protein
VPASIAAVLVITVLGVFYLGLFPGQVIEAFRTTRSAVTNIAIR